MDRATGGAGPRPVVFLHIPKTAGQTVHHGIAAVVGREAVSPYRLQRQTRGGPTFPPGYRFHSGHLDWHELSALPGDPFSFTVLRDPRERLASFYFFRQREIRARIAARAPDHPVAPVDARLLGPADRFFFRPDGRPDPAIVSLWWNAITTYLAFRHVRRSPEEQAVPATEALSRAVANARDLSAIYRVETLSLLEDDLEPLLGRRPAIAARRHNAADLGPEVSRWDRLVALFESDRAARALEDFVAEDEALMERLPLRGQ